MGGGTAGGARFLQRDFKTDFNLPSLFKPHRLKLKEYSLYLSPLLSFLSNQINSFPSYNFVKNSDLFVTRDRNGYRISETTLRLNYSIFFLNLKDLIDSS